MRATADLIDGKWKPMIVNALKAKPLRFGQLLRTLPEATRKVATAQLRELEHEGLVEGRQGLGTFVARLPSGPPPGTHARLAKSLAGWVHRARADGLDDEAIEALLRSTLRSSLDEGVA